MVWNIPPFCHHARKARAVWVCWRRQTELFERSRRIRSRSLSWIYSSLFLDANTPPRSGLPWRISWCERKTSLEWRSRRGWRKEKCCRSQASQTNGLLRSRVVVWSLGKMFLGHWDNADSLALMWSLMKNGPGTLGHWDTATSLWCDHWERWSWLR